MSSGTIIVDPLQKLIHMHPTDVVSSHTLLLPLASKLMQQLKPQADIIIKLSRKLRKKTRKSFDQGMAETQSGVSQTQAAPSVASSTSSPRRSSTSNASGSALSQSRFSKSILVDECTTATATATATPSPDDDYAMSPLLSGAISKFALILKDHLQKIVNTTIQMSWEDKKQRYQHTTNLHNAPKERTLQRSLSGSSLGTDDTSHPQPTSEKPFSMPVGSYFPMQNLGQSGPAFLNIFKQTQLFCNYCQLHATANDAISEIISEVRPGKKVDDASSLGTDSKVLVASSDAEVGNRHDGDDPLVTLFSILLSGTLPMEQDAIHKLKALSQENGKEIKSDKNEIVFASAAKSVSQHEHGGKASEADILWCNGRCNGRADTPSCTNICVDLWQQRVFDLRAQYTALDILDKSPELAHMTTKCPSGKRVTLQVRSEPPRHPKETDEQFIQRTMFVAGPSSATGHCTSPASPGGFKVSMNQNNRIRYFGKINCNVPVSQQDGARKLRATASIAHHHLRKRVRTVYVRQAKAAFKIVMFVICRYHMRRATRRWSAAITIQRSFRGDIVRTNVVELVDTLIERKNRHYREKFAATKIAVWMRRMCNRQKSSKSLLSLESSVRSIFPSVTQDVGASDSERLSEKSIVRADDVLNAVLIASNRSGANKSRQKPKLSKRQSTGSMESIISYSSPDSKHTTKMSLHSAINARKFDLSPVSALDMDTSHRARRMSNDFSPEKATSPQSALDRRHSLDVQYTGNWTSPISSKKSNSGKSASNSLGITSIPGELFYLKRFFYFHEIWNLYRRAHVSNGTCFYRY